MTMKKKKGKKPAKGMAAGTGSGLGFGDLEDTESTSAGKQKKMTKKEMKKLVATLGEEKGTLKEITEAYFEEVGSTISQPNVSKILQESWGKNYESKKSKMKIRKVKGRKWRKEFDNDRSGIAKVFHKDYVSSRDGMFHDLETGTLRDLDWDDTSLKWKGKDVITFSREKLFGHTTDPNDPDGDGTYNPEVISIFKVQLRKRLAGIGEQKYERALKKQFEDTMEQQDLTPLSLDQVIKLQKKIKRDVRKSLKETREEFRLEAKEAFDALVLKLEKTGPDDRTKTVLGTDFLERKYCPAFASSSKKFRGKQRMLSVDKDDLGQRINPETGKPWVFSRIVYNLPHLLHNHPKRLQIMSHNLAKKLPELVDGEEPLVKAKYNDTLGRNLRIRFPKNKREDIFTREAGIVITKKAADGFKYFNVVESGTLMVDHPDNLPDAWRADKASDIDNYKKFTGRVTNKYDIRRGDPISMGGLKKDLGNPVGYTEAKHSGTLIWIGPPRPKTRKLTVDPDKVDPSAPGLSDDRKTLTTEFYTQAFQIVREDEVKIGDKIISRNGLKGVISKIVDDLGKDKKGNPYEAVVNYGEVWRDSKSKKGTPEYALEEETFIKQGKRKAGTVMEHQDGDGKVFFFLIDKMAQDQLGSGLRMSTTMLSGMWEWFLQDLGDLKNVPQAEIDEKLTEFVERYFGEKGTFIPTLKAMHYKAVKRGNQVRIEINDKDHSPNEPMKDAEGDWVYLPHTFAGRSYDYAYIPHSISRVYFNGRTIMEYYQVDPDNKNPGGASGFYWSFIVKQLKNQMYMLPRNELAVNLVATPYAREGEETNYMPIRMDAFDVINTGANPYDPDLKMTLRKEPVTDRYSIQTHPVDVDWSGDYNGIIGIHPEIALKATIDYDGDQVVAWNPVIEQAEIKLTKEEEKILKDSLKPENYKRSFEDLHKKAEETFYADDEVDLGVKSAKYNQNTAELENTMIQTLGGLRKRALLFYGSNIPEPVKYGSEKDPREEELTPDLINKVTDVEKVLKMREPQWKIRELRHKNWDDLTDYEKDLIKDHYIRLQLNRRLQKLVDSESLTRLLEVVRNEKAFIDEENKIIDRSVDPINLEIDIGSGRLIDRVIWQQLKNRPDILEVEF